MKVLVIEDDNTLQMMVSTVLERNQFEVFATKFGTEGLSLVENHDFDCIILDMGLPDTDGMDVLKQLRNNKNDVPLLIVSARDSVDNKVSGLYEGADDYLTKPFDFKELVARVQTIIKRKKRGFGENEFIKCGEIVINQLTREMAVNGNTVILTNNEYKLLIYFIKHKDTVISKEHLSSEVWDINFDTQTNFVNVYISYLRKKIGEFSNLEYIRTMRGKGFKFISEPEI